MCIMCDALYSTKGIYALSNEERAKGEPKKTPIFTVALVVRTKTNGCISQSRFTDYGKGCGYKLNYCPVCGRNLNDT